MTSIIKKNMGNYEQLKQSVSDVIKTNGNQEITGSILQNVLLTIISTVGANATFAGIATPATNPGTPDGSVFYLASESGTYTNFGNIELQDGLSVLMWNGSWNSQQIFSIDDEPTAGSDNMVKSGGVQEELALGAVYDVSAKNPTAGPNNDGKFESLSALLSDANLNTLIPTAVRKGGMSIKFIQSSDNKYVQYRYMLTDVSTAATFTNMANWQGVDTEITLESHNLIESGAVAKRVEQIEGQRVYTFYGETDESISICLDNGLEVTSITAKENILEEGGEIDFCDDEETEKYASIGEYGIKTKSILDTNGTTLFYNPFKGKRVLFFGDSLVAASYSVTNGGFVKLIADKYGCPYYRYWGTNSPSNAINELIGFKNVAKDGTTLREHGTNDSIYERVINWCTPQYCDVAIIQGGTNDFNVNMGELSEGYDAVLDTTTTIGALEGILKHCTNNGIKVCFIIMHKVSYIADNYYDFAKQACAKWGVPYIDLQHSAGFHMSANNVVHGTMYSIAPAEWDNTKTYYLDDKVSYDGKSYKCRANGVIGIVPTNDEYWLKTSNYSHDFCHLNNLGHYVISDKIEQFIKSI